MRSHTNEQIRDYVRLNSRKSYFEIGIHFGVSASLVQQLAPGKPGVTSLYSCQRTSCTDKFTGHGSYRGKKAKYCPTHRRKVVK